VPPTTQKFGWKDRDTAARDLLQLVYHAPDDISRRALELLPAIRSSAIVPELLEYVRDEQVWNREIALRAVSLASENIYLPELRKHLPGKVNSFNAHTYMFTETVQLVKRHPRNRDWLDESLEEHFAYVNTLPLAKQLGDLIWLCRMYREGDELSFPVRDYLMRFLEIHPEFLTLEAVTLLYFRDDRPTTQAWLKERWQRIEDLCLNEGNMFSSTWSYYLSVLVEHWEELRESLFANYPTFIAVYNTNMNAIKAIRVRNHPPLEVTHAPLWQEMAAHYTQALEGDKASRRKLSWGLVMSTDMLEKAVATHFYARILAEDSENFLRLIDLVNEGSMGWRWSDEWLTQNIDDPDLNVLYTPAQFELCDVLRAYPSPRAWTHQRYFLDWIAYQTDVLSGLEVEYTGATLAVEDRPWFRALVQQETG
jgi:hypothetical protein